MIHAASVAVSVDVERPGAATDARFAGLSYEVSALLPVDGVRYFRADNRPLIDLFRTLGIRSLRIGGNTSDRNVRQLPSEADLDSLFAFAEAADVQVIYCLQLHKGDPAVAAATAKYISDRYARLVDSFSIGQEPSAYPVEKVDTRPAAERMGAAAEKYPYTAYRDEWKRFHDAIIAAVPDIRLCGPGVHNNGEWPRRFMEDFGQEHRVSLITAHLYPGGAAHRLPSAEVGRERMLSGELLRVYEKLHDGFVPAARALGLPYRLEEVNSYFNGGAQEASNTYAAALWGLEFMHWWAAHGAAGLNFHTGDRVSMNNDYQPPRYAAFLTTAEGFEIRPLAYAFKAFALGGQGRPLPLAFDRTDAVHLAAYAVLGDDDAIYVTLINKTHGPNAAAADVELTLSNEGRPHAETVSLQSSGGDVAATTGITFGEAMIEARGGWKGAWKPLPAPPPAGKLRVAVPAASAVVLRLTR